MELDRYTTEDVDKHRILKEMSSKIDSREFKSLQSCAGENGAARGLRCVTELFDPVKVIRFTSKVKQMFSDWNNVERCTGLLVDINCVWLANGSHVVLWNYWSGFVTTLSRQIGTVETVGLVPDLTRSTDKAECYYLVVASEAEVQIYELSSKGRGCTINDKPIYSVGTNGVTYNTICTTPHGRIFMGGVGGLVEIKDKRPRVGRVDNHDIILQPIRKGLGDLVVHRLSSSIGLNKSEDNIEQLVYCAAPSPLLFVLLRRDTQGQVVYIIEMWDLGACGEDITFVLSLQHRACQAPHAVVRLCPCPAEIPGMVDEYNAVMTISPKGEIATYRVKVNAAKRAVALFLADVWAMPEAFQSHNTVVGANHRDGVTMLAVSYSLPHSKPTRIVLIGPDHIGLANGKPSELSPGEGWQTVLLDEGAETVGVLEEDKRSEIKSLFQLAAHGAEERELANGCYLSNRTFLALTRAGVVVIEKQRAISLVSRLVQYSDQPFEAGRQTDSRGLQAHISLGAVLVQLACERDDKRVTRAVREKARQRLIWLASSQHTTVVPSTMAYSALSMPLAVDQSNSGSHLTISLVLIQYLAWLLAPITGTTHISQSQPLTVFHVQREADSTLFWPTISQKETSKLRNIFEDLTDLLADLKKAGRGVLDSKLTPLETLIGQLGQCLALLQALYYKLIPSPSPALVQHTYSAPQAALAGVLEQIAGIPLVQLACRQDFKAVMEDALNKLLHSVIDYNTMVEMRSECPDFVSDGTFATQMLLKAEKESTGPLRKAQMENAVKLIGSAPLLTNAQFRDVVGILERLSDYDNIVVISLDQLTRLDKKTANQSTGQSSTTEAGQLYRDTILFSLFPNGVAKGSAIQSAVAMGDSTLLELIFDGLARGTQQDREYLFSITQDQCKGDTTGTAVKRYFEGKFASSRAALSQLSQDVRASPHDVEHQLHWASLLWQSYHAQQQYAQAAWALSEMADLEGDISIKQRLSYVLEALPFAKYVAAAQSDWSEEHQDVDSLITLLEEQQTVLKLQECLTNEIASLDDPQLVEEKQRALRLRLYNVTTLYCDYAEPLHLHWAMLNIMHSARQPNQPHIDKCWLDCLQRTADPNDVVALLQKVFKETGGTTYWASRETFLRGCKARRDWGTQQTEFILHNYDKIPEWFKN